MRQPFVKCCLGMVLNPLLCTGAVLAAANPVAPANDAAADPAVSSPGPAQNRFDIQEIRVLGNSVLQNPDIERAVYPFAGPNKSLTDVEAARTALEAAYHDKGFATVFVDIPEQSVDQGIIRLHVTEGRLRKVSLSGARYFSGREIRAAIPAATEGAVPEISALQKQLTAVNSVTRDRVVVPVLKAGPVPGTVDLALKVEDHAPAHASVEINNAYTADTAPLRAIALASFDNAFGRGDSVSLQYQYSPQKPSEVGVFAAGYVTGWGDDGARVAFTFVRSNSEVTSVGTLGVVGKGKIFGVRATYPIEATAARQQSVSAGVDYKDFGQSIRLSNSALESPVHYPNFSIAYAEFINAPTRLWSINAAVNFGIRRLFNDVEQFAAKCFGCRPNYVYFRSDASVRQQLPHGFTILGRIAGQYSATPLISNEQFLLGGSGTVRGYLEAEELGDTGLRGGLELGLPAWRFGGDRFSMNSFLFADGGMIGFQRPVGDQPSRQTLGSWGAGLNVRLWQDLEADVSWARALKTGSKTLSGESRVLFSVRASW